jgi:diguanylate cyclase (GGDEF)-like protein
VDDQARNQVPALAGTRFWVYICAVCLTGLALLVLAVSAGRQELPALLTTAAFWTVLVLIVLGEVRPMVTAAMTDLVGIVTSAAFVFATLLFFGLPVAALLHLLASVLTGVVHRRAWWRTCFNAAQYTVSLTSAWLVLSAFGLSASVTSPYVPTGRDALALALAAAAYSCTNHLLVWSAVALADRQPLADVARKDARYQLVVDASLFSIGTVTAVLMGHAPYLVLLLIVPLLAVSRIGTAGAVHERRALTDQLTGLANRSSLISAAAEAIEASRRTGQHLAVLALDLDGFKQVNDTAGHHVGDHVLRITASRLTAAVRSGDVVARLGGDEFALLLTDVTGSASVAEVAARLRLSLCEPVVVDGQSVRVGASVGVALFPGDGEDLEALLRVADRGMYADKAAKEPVRAAGG